MRKRFLILLLVCVMLLSAAASVYAMEDNVILTVKTLGIMVGDTNGNMRLDEYVTRAQFAKMMVAASQYRDTVSEAGTGVSLYRDVKGNHWASGYIQIAASNGWMTGYVDGSFRPDNNITLEEACTALLRMLGFDTSALVGAFPKAQLNKAESLGLTDGLTCLQGQKMTRRDSARLFYNLLDAQTEKGQSYAQTIGYSVSDGHVDYTSVAVQNMKGPFIADDESSLPFTPLTIYRNGEASESASLNKYDVYYYNSGLRSLWIYTNRVSGKITALSPSASDPDTVSVFGTNYAVSSADAAYKLSVFGCGGTGNFVTLLLGMENKVVGVLSGDEMESFYYGVVQSCSKTADANAAKVQTQLKVFCTDGYSHSFVYDGSLSFSEGALVSVNVSSGNISVKTLQEKGLSGSVDSSAGKIGEYKLAADVRIIDTVSAGEGIKIDRSRIANTSLSGRVRYYTLDSDGRIDNLILNDVTGDIRTYVYMADVADNSRDMSVSASYSYYDNGKLTNYQSNGSSYPVQEGGVAIQNDASGKIKSMRQLKSVDITGLGMLYAMAGNVKYDLSDNVQVYLYHDGNYFLTSISSVNSDEYKLVGWYDDFACPAGKQIRIIVAVY